MDAFSYVAGREIQMITGLRIKNFKGWKDTKPFRLAPITGLFGTNSSGKTSLLQLLLLLKQTSESADRRIALDFGDDKTPVALGTLLDVLYRHDDTNALEWAVEWIPRADERATLADDIGNSVDVSKLELAGAVSSAKSGPRTDSFSYSFGKNRIGYRYDPGRRRYSLEMEPADLVQFGRPVGRPPLSEPTKCYGFPDELKSYSKGEVLADLELTFESLMSSLYYLGPLRDDPKRQYVWGGAQPRDVGMRGQLAVAALLAARARSLMISPGPRKKRQHLEKYVATWLERLSLISRFEVREVRAGSNLFQVHILRDPESADVLLTDVGFGVSQILPVIVLCFYVPEGSTVLLEQPEIHLHPAVQAGLADVLIDAVNRRGIQVIIESHSEHLVRRLLRRVAEDNIRSTDCALYFCDSMEGHNVLTELELTEKGAISNWPKGFFGEPLEEAVATTRAVAARFATAD